MAEVRERFSEESGETLEVAEAWPEARRQAVGLTLSRWIMNSLFLTRAVHTDPHPGNFAFRDDGSVVVYDMGCVKNVPEPIVLEVWRLVQAAVDHDWASLHAALIAMKGIKPDIELSAVQELYEDFTRTTMDKLLEQPKFDFVDRDFMNDLLRAGRKHLLMPFKFQPVSDLIFLMRALAGCTGYFAGCALHCRSRRYWLSTALLEESKAASGKQALDRHFPKYPRLR